MEYAEAERHTRECYGSIEDGRAPPEEVWGEEVARIVRRRQEEVRREREWVM